MEPIINKMQPTLPTRNVKRRWGGPMLQICKSTSLAALKEGRHTRGQREWRDDVDEFWKGTNLHRNAQGRLKWKPRSEALARRWDIIRPPNDDDDDDTVTKTMMVKI